MRTGNESDADSSLTVVIVRVIVMIMRARCMVMRIIMAQWMVRTMKKEGTIYSNNYSGKKDDNDEGKDHSLEFSYTWLFVAFP